jgi:hypothetical protein
VNEDLERNLSWLKVLSVHYLGRTEENHENFSYETSSLKLEPASSRIEVKFVTSEITLFAGHFSPLMIFDVKL